MPDDEKEDEEREVLNQMQKVVLQVADDEFFTYIYLTSDGMALKTVSLQFYEFLIIVLF